MLADIILPNSYFFFICSTNRPIYVLVRTSVYAKSYLIAHVNDVLFFNMLETLKIPHSP